MNCYIDIMVFVFYQHLKKDSQKIKKKEIDKAVKRRSKVKGN